MDTPELTKEDNNLNVNVTIKKEPAAQADQNNGEDEYSDGFELIFRDERYLNRLCLLRYDIQTERLRTLAAIMREFLPGYSMHVRSGNEVTDPTNVPSNVRQAFDRSMCSILNQVSRITSTDLEPIYADGFTRDNVAVPNKRIENDDDDSSG